MSNATPSQLEEALEGAEAYRNLGALAYLDEAINAYQTVLLLGQEHEDQEEIAMAYGNLGVVYKTRGDLDKAIEYYNKSLKISESLGLKETTANQYANLGALYETKKDYKKAREYWEKSLTLYKALGMPDAKDVQGWLDGLPR